MKKIVIFGALAASVALYSCKDDSDRVDIGDLPGEQTIELSYDFESDDEGWNAGLADLPEGDFDIYSLDADHTTDLPYNGNGALRVSASNPNNEFFMYITKHLTGLEPNTTYNVSYNVQFAASVTVDTTGIIVEPDTTGFGNDTTGVIGDTINVGYVDLSDSIIFKAGAVDTEPATEVDAFDFLRLIFDKGEIGYDGADLVVLGRFPGDTASGGYVLRNVTNDDTITVTTNDDGEVWLVIGTEATGSDVVVYYERIHVELEER